MRPDARHLILYDGVCGLCNSLNAFVLRHDTRAVFHFASLQSKVGRSIVESFSRRPEDLDTFYVVPDFNTNRTEILDRAQAALFVAKTLGGVFGWLSILNVLPKRVLNAGYNLIARNRYRLFGRYDQCPLPKPEYRTRFIDLDQ